MKKLDAFSTRLPWLPTMVICASHVIAIPGILGGRIRMGKRAADRPPIANLIVRDMPDRFRKQRMASSQSCVTLDIAPPDLGAESDPIIADVNGIEILQML